MKRFNGVMMFVILFVFSVMTSSCGSVASALSSLLEQCENLSSDELNVDLSDECRDLEGFLADNQDNLTTKTEIMSVREGGGYTDAVLLITDSEGNPVTGLDKTSVTASVSDDSGATYTTLTDYDVYTYEELATREPGSDHMSFASVIDYSGSILDDDLDFVTDSLVYVYQNMPEMYRSEVVKFSTDVQVTQAFTSDTAALISAVQDTSYERGYTSMYDGMYQALQDTAAETATLKLNILFTDGVDNDSTVDYDTVKAYFQAQKIPVCVVGVGFANVTTLREIADDSGCFFIYRQLFTELEGAFESVVSQMEDLYRVRMDPDDLVGMDTLKLTVDNGSGVREVTSAL
ncbi:MAG: VWA domain-containing protein [Deltaproteobacteria bacterium]|jgi:hypothetical protein|nr:VWA domain-containing protein [Deltaproteobacteria bacterium]